MIDLAVKYSVPAEKADDVLTCVTNYLGYSEDILKDDGKVEKNPVTRQQHLDAAIQRYIEECYVAYKVQEADAYRDTARKAAKAVFTKAEEK